MVPPGARAHPGRGAARARRGRRRRRGRRARRRAEGRRRAGRGSTPRWPPASAAGPPTGRSRASPSASRSVPATWPRATSRIVRRDTGEKRTVPVGEVEHRVTNLLAHDPGRRCSPAPPSAATTAPPRSTTIDEAVEAGQGRLRQGPLGRRQGRAARPAWPRRPSPSAASRPRTAASPPARTTPTSSPTSPGRTSPTSVQPVAYGRVDASGIGRLAGRVPALFRRSWVLERRGLRPAPLPCIPQSGGGEHRR